MPNVVANVWFFVAKTLATGGFGAFLIKTAGMMMLNVAASKLFGPKAPKGAGLAELQVMNDSALEFRKIVYGEAIVSGPRYYKNTSGTDNEYLWYCIDLARGESEDLVSVLFDNDVIPKADIDWAAGTGASDGTGTGDVSTAKWIGDNSTKAVQIYYYLGDDDQPACGNMVSEFADWTTNHRLRGVTHIVVKMLYNEDTENVWKKGPPNNIRAVLKGRKIYDPRLDTTNGGSGTHRYATPSTWTWSENPALCDTDYEQNVMNVDPATAINWTSVADSADDCEVSAAIPASTEDRFTCNGALSLGSTHKDNLDSILSSMDGKLSYSGGVWKVRASVWEASSVTITADDLAGPVDVRGSAPKSERFNGIRGFFIDPARNYEAAEFPHISDSTYLTRDNSEVIQYDLQLPMTNTATMAQRIAMRNLEQGDNQIVCVLHMNARGAKVAVGDVVSLTLSGLSWSSKTFRCIEWNRNPDGTYKVTLREDTAASYTDPVEGDYGTGNTGGVTVPSDVVPAPSSLLATSVQGGIQLTWTNPPAAEYDYIDVYEDSDNGWSGATRIARIRADTYTVPHDDEATYYYWVRAVRLPDLESIRDPDSDTTTISAVNGTGADGADGATGAQGDTGAAGSDGSDGNDGNSVHASTIYRRSASAPSTPTGGSFNFTTNTLTAPTNWYAAPPSGSDPLYASIGTWSISGVTGTDTSTTWSTPVQQDSGTPAGPRVQAYGATLSDYSDTPTNAECGIRVGSDGEMYTFEVAGSGWGSSIGTWLLDGVVGDYEVGLFQTTTSESLAVGTDGAYASCSSNNDFEFHDTSSSGGNRIYEAEIRWIDTVTKEHLSTAAVKMTVRELP